MIKVNGWWDEYWAWRRQVYGQQGRQQWLARLPQATRLAADHLYAEFDALEPIKAEVTAQWCW
jgi:hypothetical protein